MKSLYIAHSGVKGMHWGVRRYQNEDGSYTEAGKQRYSSGESSTQSKKSGMSDRTKRALKIGAAVAGAALIGYGAYKLHGSLKQSSIGKAKLGEIAGEISSTTVKFGTNESAVELPRKDALLKSHLRETVVTPSGDLERVKSSKDYGSTALDNLAKLRTATSTYSSRANSAGSDIDRLTEELLKKTRMK